VVASHGEAREHALITRQELKDIIQALEKQSMPMFSRSTTTPVNYPQIAMSHSCCREHIRHLLEAVSICSHQTDPALILNAVADVLEAAKEPISSVVNTVSKLSQAASKMPYYKFNNMWSRQMQGAVRITISSQQYQSMLTALQVEVLLLWGWLGGYKYEGGEVKCGQLLTIEDLGEILHSKSNVVNYIPTANSVKSPLISRTVMNST
jgi:hypothetical protein